MIFRQLFDSTSSTYTYLLADTATREAILIDPVFELHARDVAMLREMDLKLKYTLDTHVHADHVTGAWLMRQALGSQIVLSGRFGADFVDRPADHGDTIQFGDYFIEIRATPGHTAGCLSYVTSNHEQAFTGDSLLIRGAGRTDFQEGSAKKLYHSVKEQIFTLPETCLIYPAHDYNGRTVSTVGEEKRFNARLGGDATERDFIGHMENLALPHPKKIDIAVPANMRCGRPEDEEEAPKTPSWGPVILNYAGIYQLEAGWVYEHRGQLHLLDVRTPQELEEDGAIEEAQLIPLDELRNRIEEIPKQKPIVAICHSGSRSGQATKILTKAGFDKVANLAGGIARWKSLSYPTQ